MAVILTFLISNFWSYSFFGTHNCAHKDLLHVSFYFLKLLPSRQIEKKLSEKQGNVTISFYLSY